MVRIDVSGDVVEISSAAVALLRDAAAADSGRSSVRRDLSLILERALRSSQTVALRQSEARELAAQPEAPAFDELRERLRRGAC